MRAVIGCADPVYCPAFDLFMNFMSSTVKSAMKAVVRSAIGLFFVLAGTMHFVNPQPFVEIVPRYLPAPFLLVYLSGFFEIVGGIGLVIPRLRRLAAWGLIALLVAVLPANIFMLTDHPFLAGQRVPDWVLWVRLPLQGVLIALIWWTSCRRRDFVRGQGGEGG